MIKIILCFILIMLFSYSSTALVRLYALRNNMLDVPCERSSHSRVTPRGGGLAIVSTFILSLAFIANQGMIPTNLVAALMGGGLMVAAIGWWDDRISVSPGLRLGVHFLAAVWALYWLGGLTKVSLGFTTISLGWVWSIIVVIGIIWLINLYNFMDGIDGLAGVEAITVLLCASFLCFRTDFAGLAWVCTVLGLAVGGFLIWNWPPARIFMGDAGSGFMGFIFAVLAIWSEQIGAVPLIIWIMLLGVFITDATITLIRRFFAGERLNKPHRTHVYQLAIQARYSHKRVTLAVLMINTIIIGIAIIAFRWGFLLLPLAFMVAFALTVIYMRLYSRFSRIIGSLEDTDTTINGYLADAAVISDE